VLLVYTVAQKDLRRRKILVITSICLLYFFSNSFIFNECMRLWEHPAKKTLDIKKPYNAVIVLGGLSYYDPEYDRVQFSRGTDRLMQALLIYKHGYAKKLFFTGGSGSLTFPSMKEAPQIKRFLVELGIPSEDLLIETESRNTRENATMSKEILDQVMPGGRFLIVTSAFHMRRAEGCFQKAGINADTYPVDRYSGPTRTELDFLLVPSVDIFASWSNLIHEIAGFVIYKIAGYC
jgi:uncharacterized SAM-binding protein YcdF (DUF218 family)